MKIVSTHHCTFTLEELMGMMYKSIEEAGYTPVPGAIPQETRVDGKTVWTLEAYSASEGWGHHVPQPSASSSDKPPRLKKDGTPWDYSHVKGGHRRKKGVANPTTDPLSGRSSAGDQ